MKNNKPTLNKTKLELEFTTPPEILKKYFEFKKAGLNNLALTGKLNKEFPTAKKYQGELISLIELVREQINAVPEKRFFLNILGYDSNYDELGWEVLNYLFIDLPLKYLRNDIFTDKNYCYLVINNIQCFINPVPYESGLAKDKHIQNTKPLEKYLKSKSIDFPTLQLLETEIQNCGSEVVNGKPIVKLNFQRNYENPYKILQALVNANQFENAQQLFNTVSETPDVHDVLNIAFEYIYCIK